MQTFRIIWARRAHNQTIVASQGAHEFAVYDLKVVPRSKGGDKNGHEGTEIRTFFMP